MLASEREPVDQTGTVGSLYYVGLAADRMGGKDISRRTPADASHRARTTLIMHEVSFEEALELIQAKDPRYQRDAYLFVREALDYTQKNIGKDNKGRIRHVTGQELLEGIRDFALAQFGPMTLTVLEEWGIRACSDFGEIVFNMVEIGLLAKTDKDNRTDFAEGYDFFEAFRKPFLPQSKLAARETASAGSHDAKV
jgi:uncharacterized repeat protein (TIGR04138 family)